MKGNIEHTIPLTTSTKMELSRLSDGKVNYFPKLNISHSMKVFREALNARATRVSGGSCDEKTSSRINRDVTSIPHFTLHDFRRYLSSTMSKLKIPIDITEAILAHRTGSRSQIQRTYDRDTRLPQMHEAFEKYHAHLVEIGCNPSGPSRTASTST